MILERAALVILCVILASSCAAADRSSRQACVRDSIADLSGLAKERLPKSHYSVVPLKMQAEAQANLEGKDIILIDSFAAGKFSNIARSDNAKPYLIRVCIFGLERMPDDSGVFDGAVGAASVDLEIIRDRSVVVANTFVLTARNAKPGDVIFVVWSDHPISEVRMAPYGAV